MSFSDFLGDLFAGSYAPLGGVNEEVTQKLQVDEIFSGINYLQALNKVSRTGLSSYLNSGDFKYYSDDDAKKANSTGSNTLKSSSTDSIFNKFSVFAYQNFMSGGSYRPEYHFIGAYNTDTKLKEDTSDTINAKNNLIAAAREILAIKDKNKLYSDSKAFEARTNTSAAIRKTATVLSNPNVKNIIEWANNTSSISVTGFQPYAMTDFMFCKYYGKIPNNRLVTLRRYPFPINDQIKIRQGNVYKSPIPTAQAVTWFGGDTGNVLSEIGVLNWGMKFQTLTVTQQDIKGNEVTIDEITSLVKGLPKTATFDPAKLIEGLKVLGVAAGGNDEQLQQLTGMDAKFQKYAENLYTANGPYWNRIFGPVNVINESTQRVKGMQPGWNNPFTLKFHYQFRSFNGLSPKIVALDLIASFLNLTYNDAQFQKQLARYFPKPGLKFSPTITEQLGALITNYSMSFNSSTGGDILKLMNEIQKIVIPAAADATSGNPADTAKNFAKRAIQAAGAKILAPAIPEILSFRSALSDRAVGEWHLVVGNPMNPIIVMGDLLCSKCVMTFDTEIGPEDFPTGITFAVTLQQGKPRDKVAIERMFNLGESQLMANKLRDPASAADTFGDANNSLFEELAKGTDAAKVAKLTTDNPSFQQYRNRIRKSYGYDADDTAGAVSQETGVVNDSLLYMYFDKSLEKN